MRWLHLCLAPLPFMASVAMAGACSRDSAAILLSMTVRQGLLDTATKVELRVIDTGAACDSATGEVSGSTEESETFDLERNGCAAGAKWCKDITVEQSDEAKVFEVTATAGGDLIARGCSAVVVDQDPLDVSINVVANIAPKCCNDGALQVGEQCDSGVIGTIDCRSQPTNGAVCSAISEDFVCHCDCLAREIPLSASTPAGVTPAIGNAPGSKSEPALAFAGGNAEGGIPGSLRAVFTDGGDGLDINLRVLDGDMYPAPSVLGQQIRLPQDCESMAAPVGPPQDQKQPDIARVDDNLLAVVFADDRAQPTQFDVRLLVQNQFGCNDSSPPSFAVCMDDGCTGPPCTTCFPPKLNTLSGIETPAVAGGPMSRAFVAWRTGGAVHGRIWVPGANSDCDTCLPAGAELDLGQTSGKPRVSGHANGFLVTYATANNVVYRTVSAEGVPGAEQKVNIGTGVHEQPAIAALPDGRFAVVWRNDGRILFQRYDANGVATVGDQDEPLSKNSPPGFEPQIAAAQGGGAFWAVVWVAQDSTTWARYIDDVDKFLRNPVNGLLDDFPVGHPAVAATQRYTPDVAIGGNGFVAFGWADLSADPSMPTEGRGIRVRRFPLPE